MSTKVKQKELTGRHVLLMLLAFFGVMLAVNAYFTVAAVKTFRGEDVKRSYRQGLDYNQTLQQRAQQSELGWTVAANTNVIADDRIEILLSFNNQDSRGIGNLKITGGLSHRVDSRFDKQVTFRPVGGGRYKAVTEGLEGPYILKAVANKDDTAFRFEHAFDVK
jgi:nitrogen fixation protein FixH